MLVMLHLLVTVFCTFECARCFPNVRGNFFKLVMFSGVGTVHGLVPLLTPRSLMWPYASDSALVLAAFLALVGVIMFSIGWRLYEMSRPDWLGLAPGLLAFIESPEGQRLLRRLFWLCAFLALVTWLGSLILSAGSVGAAFRAARFEFRGGGEHRYLGTVLSHAQAMFLVVPGFLCFFLSGRHRVVGIAFSVTLAILVFVASQGGRAAPMGLIGCLVMGYVLRYQMTPRRFALIAGATVGLLLLGVALYEVRKVMANRSLGELGEIILSGETYQGALTRDPLSYHRFLVAAVEHFPKDHPYLNGATYRRLAVFYLPQAYFPEIKPPDTNNVFARVVTEYGTRATIPPTMMGDGYINFWGLPGVIVVMLFNGVLLGLATRRIRENLLWFLAIGAPFMRFAILSIRGQPYEILTVALSSLGFMWLVGRICGVSYASVKSRIRQVNQEARSAGRPVAPYPAVETASLEGTPRSVGSPLSKSEERGA